MTLSIVIPVRSIGTVPALPPGADEILLVAGDGITRARNNGAKAARGTVLLHTDDDVELVGDLGYLRNPPPSEAWWIPAGWVDATGDRYTVQIVTLLNLQTLFRGLGCSVGSFQAVRASAFHAVGGYDETRVHEDWDLARRLRARFGKPSVAPITVRILRRTVTAPEHWQRMREARPPSDGPVRRLVPPQVELGGNRGV